MRPAERDAMFLPDPDQYEFLPELYSTLRDNETVLLDGDHDLFGDGSPVVLSGDAAHFKKNFENRRVPALSDDAASSVLSMNRLAQLTRQESAYLWLNHDAAHTAAQRRATDFIE